MQLKFKMSNESESEFMVIAKHNFVGKNNDEVLLNKKNFFLYIL